MLLFCSLLSSSKCWRHSSKVHKGSWVIVFYWCRGVINLFSWYYWYLISWSWGSGKYLFWNLTKTVLSLISLQCFIVSTVNALQTPMINASMVSCSYEISTSYLCSYIFLFPNNVLCQVLCDRHFGGINYPVGGVGGIAKSLANGLIDQGSEILYKANVTNIILEHGKAVSWPLWMF